MIEGASILSEGPATSPCLIVSGATHGNEPAGPVAIEHLKTLITSGDWQIAGTVYTLIANPRALENKTRFVEENLNRAFGRAANPHSYEAKRAAEIAEWFAEIARTYKTIYLIDVHSVSIGETRIAIYNADNARAKEWVGRISPIPFKFGTRTSVLPGSIMDAIGDVGGIGMSLECGNHSSETGATVALEHIENALEHAHMLTKKTTSFKELVHYEGDPRAYQLTEVIKPSKGFAFTIPVHSELFLKKDQVYARDDAGERRAPYDCHVLIPAKDPHPGDFDAGFLGILEK